MRDHIAHCYGSIRGLSGIVFLILNSSAIVSYLLGVGLIQIAIG